MGDNKVQFEDEQERLQFKKNIELRNGSVRKLFKEEEQISGCSLKLDYVFGINDRTVSNQLQLVGDGLAVFSVANMIVIKDLINTKGQTFLHREGRFKNVTALCASQKKKDKILVAAGESTTIDDKQATIVIAKTHRQRWRILPMGIKGTIKQIQLNLEKKYCAAIVQPIGQNVPILSIWSYKKERLLASAPVKAQFDKFSFHPQKSKHLLLSGHNYLRIWEIFFQEKQLKEQHEQLIPLKVEKENKFLDHCWVPQNATQSILVLLAAGNRLIILQNEQLKKIIDIDVQNLNMVDASLKDVNVGEESDDIVGLNTVLEDMIKEKIGGLQQLGLTKDTTMANKQTQNQSNTMNVVNIEFLVITSSRKGFILGGSKGCVCTYEFDKNFSIVSKLSFAMKTQNSIEHRICYVSTSDSIITIISQTSPNQLTYNVLNTLQLDTEVSPIQSFFSAGVHNKRVHCISSAITKQIFATCSEDNTVKIWNYYESETSEKKGTLSKYFKEEPLSVAMHPFGIFLTVGFSNGFKVFAILTDSLFALKEVGLSNCRIVRYSNGGHYLLTNEKSNLVIYDSIYYETISVLDGHTALIKDVAISENDNFIVSTCINGYVFCWNLAESQSNILKEPEHQENTIYNSVQYDVRTIKTDKTDQKPEEIDLFVGCTNEKYLCLYRRHAKDIVAEFDVQDCYLTKLVLSISMKVLIAGTSKGTIRIMPWPLEEQNLEFEIVHPQSNEVRFKAPEFFEIQVHSSPISSLELSYDNQYLFSGAEDGSVFMLKVKDIVTEQEIQEQVKRQTALSQKAEDKLRIAIISNDLFLDEIFKIQKENDKIQQRNFEVIKSEQTVRIETQKLDQMFKSKIDQINKDFLNTMESDRKMKDTFVQKSEEEYKKLLKQYEEEKARYSAEVEVLKQSHHDKIIYEQQRNGELEQQIEEVKSKHKQDLLHLLTQHKDDLKKLKMNFYEKCQKVQVKYSNVVDNAKNYGTAFIQRLEKEDAEYEKEIDDQIKDLHDQIAKVKLVNAKLSDQNQVLIKSYEQLKREDEELQNQFEMLFKNHNQIRHDNLKNDEDILKMQHQLLERLQVIDSKEDTCKAAKDEQINLENFRYMLDQKIKSLQNDKTQLLNKITDKEKNLKSMFNELIKESNLNELKYQELKKLTGEQEVLETQVKKSEIEIFLNANKLNHYESTLLSIIKSNDQPSQIAQKLYDMIEHSQENEEMQKISKKKTITNDDIKEIIKLKQDKPNEVNDELLRQGKWMTKKLYLIKVTSDKLKEIREDNINTILNQNTKLIEECNMLRSENEKYRKKIKNVEKLLAEAIRKRQKLRLKQQGQGQPQYNQLVKKLEDNNQKLQSQKFKLANIKDSINDILNKPADQSSRKIQSTSVIQEQVPPRRDFGIVEELEQERVTTSELKKKPLEPLFRGGRDPSPVSFDQQQFNQ